MDERDGEPTRKVRRGFYMASATLTALEDVVAAAGDRSALLGVLCRHLELAWDDGAAREADLRTALSTEQSARKRVERENLSLKAQLHEMLKRVSREREEP